MNDLDAHIPAPALADHPSSSSHPLAHSSSTNSDPLSLASSTPAHRDNETAATAPDAPSVITVHFPTTPADLLAPILRIVPFAQTLADRHFAAHADGMLSTAAPVCLTPESLNVLNAVASLFLFIVGRILSIRMTFDTLVAAHARALRHPYRIRRARLLAFPMPELLNTARLADLAASLGPLERDLYDLFDAWASIPGYVPPDATLRDALNYLCTLTSIRKTLWRVATGEIDLTTGLLRTLHADVAAATADPSFAPDPDDRSSITACPSIPLYKIPPVDLLKFRLALMIACASGADDSVMRHIADAPNRHARAAERHNTNIDDAYDYLAARAAARTPDPSASDIDPSVRLTADELASTPYASSQDFPDSFPSLFPPNRPHPPPGAA